MDNKINKLRGVRDILHNYFGFASVIITNYHLGPSGLDNNSPYPSPLRLLTYHYPFSMSLIVEISNRLFSLNNQKYGQTNY